MAEIFLFGGEKGGTGKSFVCRCGVQYHLDNNISLNVYDTDRSNPDLKRIYGRSIDVKLGVFSEGVRYEDTANSIYNTAIATRTLVNLSAQVFPAMKLWFENNDLFEIAQEDGVNFVLWFVTDGGYDSLNLLGKSLEYFQDRAKHIVVKNHGTGGDDWEPLNGDDRLQGLIADYGATVIDFPRFIGNSTRNRIDAENLTFGEARESQSFGSIGRQRVKKFLREAYTAFEAAQILNPGGSSDEKTSA